ncbi:MAG: ABC transporter permease [Paracoccaceae bacterium]
MSPTDATAPDSAGLAAPSREEQVRRAENVDHRGRLLAADGTPLKASLARALRREKLRAFALVAPLLLFVLITFVAPIADMLLRSVDNSIVPTTVPRVVEAIEEYDPESGEAPGEAAFRALYFDMFLAAEAKEHTKLGSRLNYQTSGMSSLFRATGREIDEFGAMVEASGGGSSAGSASNSRLGGLFGSQGGGSSDTDEPKVEPKPFLDLFEDMDERWDEAGYWSTLMLAGSEDEASGLLDTARARLAAMNDDGFAGSLDDLAISARAAELLPATAEAYADFVAYAALVEGDDPREEEPWEAVHTALAIDLEDQAVRDAIAGYDGPGASLLKETAAQADDLLAVEIERGFLTADEDWGDPDVWRTIKNYSGHYTAGYFLNALDYEYGTDGIEKVPEFEQIYLLLFWRTLVLSVTITASCLLLGYPVAWLLANLPMRTSNLLLILVLLPFWTSLLVRTSSWIVLLQDQGVINDLLTWFYSTWVGQAFDLIYTPLANLLVLLLNIALVPILAVYGAVAALATGSWTTDLWAFGWVDFGFDRLDMMFNEVGTVVAMTHILLPFMILPLYSVMKTIPPSYLRAAKSLGATNTVAFWRVYFPLSVPGIGAGSILVFILAIGYYITPELVGGTSGIFISNRIAYHVSTSLNWGLAAALGSLLLIAVLALYWLYDRIVGIDNVKLG